MARFYHVYIIPKKTVNLEQVKKKMDLALDWFKYSDNAWVLYSSSDVNKLQTRLQPLVEPDGHLFICELNIKNRNGWMPKDFWSWIKEKR